MTDFLSELERELRAAHPRRRAARRRAAVASGARSAPVVLLVLVALAGAGAFLVTVGREDGGGAGAPTTTATAPADGTLPRASVAVLNSTSRPIGDDVAEFLAPHADVDAVENRFTQPYVPQTTVHYAPGFEEQARALATVLAAEVRPLAAVVRNEARAADVVVEIGADVVGAHTFTMVRRRPLRAIGTVGILDRRGPRDVIAVDATLPRGPHDGLWLIDPVEGGTRVEFLGYAPGGRGPRLQVAFTAIEPEDDRLVVSREAGGRPGSLPRRTVAFADLHCGGGQGCDDAGG